MNQRQINLTLWTVTASLAAASLGVLALGILLKVDVEVEPPAVKRIAATTQASPDAEMTLASLEPVWKLQLRRSLIDAPADASHEASPTVVENGPFVLVGTIGNSIAMIRTAGGVVEVKGVGEAAGGGKITAIRPSQVDVEVGGQKVTLNIAREGSGG